MEKDCVIGMDFGTDSVRAVLVQAATGEVISSAVANYPRWKQGLYCDPAVNRYRQHPLDYIEAIDKLLFDLLESEDGRRVAAIATNTTGSTPVAVDAACQPLALSSPFSENPNAMFVLWKDHTALLEAEEINALAHSWEVDYTRYSGGIYSSEWFWSKILHIHRQDEAVAESVHTWMEQSDWIPAYLAGVTHPSQVKRNRCAAGHKAMWHEAFGGLPAQAFLNELDPKLHVLEGRFYHQTYTSDQCFGTLNPVLAERFGMDAETRIAVGAIDAHHGAVGAGITPNTLVKVMGTSTCDMLVVPGEAPWVGGICGQVDGSILPGTTGYEAGQSAFGDIYGWFRKMMLQPAEALLDDERGRENLAAHFFEYITQEAARLPVTESDLVFTDYHNGRRTPDANFHVKGASYGWTLSTGGGNVFKALVEATAFGSRAIMERFQQFDVAINKVIACGGIAVKSPYVVQVLADVMGVPIEVVDSEQTCALGSAVFAAVVGGFYPDVAAAQQAIAARTVKTFVPQTERKSVYDTLYLTYQGLAHFKP